MTRHVLIWLFVTLFSILLLPSMIGPSAYLAKIQLDQRNLSGEIGDQSAEFIILKADRIYTQIFEDSGFHLEVNDRFKIGQNHRNELLEETNGDKAQSWAENYVTSFFVSMYEAIFRLTQLAYWAAFAFPFIIAAGFDGLMQRKVRNESFQYSSPSKYNFMWHFIIGMTSLTFVYCTMPFAMPAVAYPMLVFVAAMSIRELLANLQRSA